MLKKFTVSNFKNFEKYQQSHFLDKNFTYADFIDTLSLVIDNKTLIELSTKTN